MWSLTSKSVLQLFPALLCSLWFICGKKYVKGETEEKGNKRRREEGIKMCFNLFPSRQHQSGCSKSIFPKICGHLTVIATVVKRASNAYICRA